MAPSQVLGPYLAFLTVLAVAIRSIDRSNNPSNINAATHNAAQNFRRRILRELKKIKIAWSGLNYSTAPGVLILHPSTPMIAPLSEPTRTAE